MTRLFILIRSLEIGGAERQLVMLLRGLDKTRFDVTVATLYGGGAFRPEIEAISGVHLLGMGKRSRWDALPALWRLSKAVRERRPHVLFGIMSPGNELSLLFGKLAGARVVWSLRTSHVDFSLYDWLPRAMLRLSAVLSGGADLIIANSEVGSRWHVAQGFRAERMIVIRNGIDTETFRRDPAAGARLRAEWGIEEGARLVGLAGRLDPMKDHATFLRAASMLAARGGDARFVCVGGGSDEQAAALKARASALGLRVVWAGLRMDMPAVFSAFDVACCSSVGEGFPNAIAEAMSCGVPCVATDVGDLPLLVGPTGIIVPRSDPAALAGGLETMLARLDRDEAACREAARARIVSEFGVERLVERTSSALLGVLARGEDEAG